ncbi:MAG: succinylglutamate desuccinylase/aspartoacylase family protein [Fuerstiella sp.]|nr:succinylglutamate desuccinylase/aspartoacylase family protein [Fuerstiella sp.]
MNQRQEFDFDRLPAGTKQAYRLTVNVRESCDLADTIEMISGDLCLNESIQSEIDRAFRDGTLSIPVLAVRGSHPGQTLVTTAGIHGDEYEGMEAIHRTFDALDPSSVSGTFVAVPAVTLPAYWMACRVNPLDGRNMARVFPGTTDGSASQRLAARLLDRVLRHASLYIDLHSAGRGSHWVTLCGYSDYGSQVSTARAAARCFGAPFIWEHPHDPQTGGRTLSATNELGIPSLYTEARGGGHARPEDVDCYTRGLANLLQYLDIADLPVAGRPESYSPTELCGSGNTDTALRVSRAGLAWMQVQPGDRIRAGQKIAYVRDLEGNIIEEVASPQDAFVVGVRAMPRVFAGDSLVILT